MTVNCGRYQNCSYGTVRKWKSVNADSSGAFKLALYDWTDPADFCKENKFEFNIPLVAPVFEESIQLKE